MCGIVGMAGDIQVADRNVFRDMLDICQLRGRDSAGAVTVTRQMTYGYVKEVGPPSFLFDRKAYTQIIETGAHAAFIGHCRHKTSGAVSRANAHPFEVEDEEIVGVHNGTLRNYHNLKGHTYNKVDSEILYEHLAEHGPEETFNKIDGAWACVWWNGKTETLNFIRNNERPLYFCWSEDRRKLYWASSVWMLLAIEAEKRVPMWKGPKDDGEDKYISLPVDTLWSFTLHPNAKKEEPTLRMKTPKKIERKAPVVQMGIPWKSGGNGQSHSSGSSAASSETAQSVWNRKTAKTHKWNHKTGKWEPKMRYSEWEKQWNEENPKKGGEVPNPFQNLDDQLPVHLRPKKETLALIQGGKSSTTTSSQGSSENSKPSTESGKALTSTSSGPVETASLPQQTSNESQKTNKSGFTNVLKNLQQGIGDLTSKAVSFRTLAGMSFITDETTGEEYSEQQVEENTGGICSFCDDPIGDLTEIYQFYGPSRFLCTHCTEPKIRAVS